MKSRNSLTLILALPVFVCLLSAAGVMAADIDLPAAYDLRTYGYVPDVMNQGKDQTCWTFAAMTALKSNYLMNVSNKRHNDFLGADSDLSELHLAWFSFKNNIHKQNFAFIKNGKIVENPEDNDVLNHPGNPQMALSFLSRQDGPVLESSLPYSGPKPAAGASPRDYKPALRLINANYISDISFSEDVVLPSSEIIKILLKSNGAVDIGVYWNTSYMSNKFAYYNPYSASGGHAVTIIGWDDNYSRENFGLLKPKKDGAWLVQNSWGESWGNGGYFWMSYEQTIRYAIVFDTEAVNPAVREYYHDDLGYTHDVRIEDSKGSTGSTVIANVFKVKGDHEKLREIGYYLTDNQAFSIIAIYDLGTENSVEKMQAVYDQKDVKSFSVIFTLALGNGYAVEDIAQVVPLTKGHYFAVVMASTPFGAGDAAAESFNNSIPVETQVPNKRTAYAEVNANETYYKVNSDDWRDAKTYKFNIGEQEVTGFNACLKAFTYVPDARIADDWSLIREGGKAQLSISLLRETAPQNISVKGIGISNVLYKVEAEDDADTGGKAGKFYTLKLICDAVSEDTTAITSLTIDGEELIHGYVDVPISVAPVTTENYENLSLTAWDKADISQEGVSFKYMTPVSGAIESTEGYTGESVTPKEETPKEESSTGEKTSSGGGGGGGCNSAAYGAGFVLMVLAFRRKVR